MSSGRVRVLIVDDSAVVRQVLTTVLQQDPEIEVIGSVPDPIFAMERMNRNWPDVVLLDIETPRMDGITFLKRLMSVRPTPVVICSTLTERGARTTMQALAAGASGFVTKPTTGLRAFLEEDAGDIVRAVKSATAGQVRRPRWSMPAQRDGIARPDPTAAGGPAGTPDAPTPSGGTTSAGTTSVALPATTERLIAIGTSTGGAQALEMLLGAVARVAAGIVVVQHMPERFTAAFAARLDSVCQSTVVEAADGDRILPGHVLIAPGGRHLAVERSGGQYRVRVTDGPRVNRHKPSVDVLFESVAVHAGRNALGVIMTGMDDDGARGLLAMRRAGARTLGQDEASCVVYGMPAAALQLGAVEQEMSLQALSGALAAFGSGRAIEGRTGAGS